MTRLTYLFAPLAIAACAGTETASTTTTTDAEYHDAARSIASASRPSGGGGEVDALIDVTVLARGGIVPGFLIAGDGKIHGRHGGFDLSFGIACRDAADHAQLLCDGFTDEADVDVAWSGALHLPGLDISISRDGHWMLSDLTTAVARIDGDGHTDYDGRLESGGTVTSDSIRYDADFDAILVPRDRAWPTGGTIQTSLVVDRTRTGNGLDEHRHLDVDAAFVFGDNGHATIVLDGSRHYDVDLTTGVVIDL